MRFEFRFGSTQYDIYPLYENNEIFLCTKSLGYDYILGDQGSSCGGCGSYGLNSNSDNTTKPPCLLTVDVNGDRKPNPDNVNCKATSCAKAYKYSDPLGLKLTDMFTLMITDKQAIPYGIAAQRAMYQARK